MSFRRHYRDAQRGIVRLDEPVQEVGAPAKKLGLDPCPVDYWVVNYDEINQLTACDGFQERYPHWRWGMTYDRQRKTDQLGMGKAFEIVNNDDLANAFLQELNSLVDQKAVITHVEAYSDFFKNSQWFGLFSDKEQFAAATILEYHAQTVEWYIQNPGISQDDVEKFIDAVLCLEGAIDQHQTTREAAVDENGHIPEDTRVQLNSLDISDDVRREVFDDAWLEQVEEAECEAAKLTDPRKDVFVYIREHGMWYDGKTGKAEEMESWQKDVPDMPREEVYYFAVQKVTKVMNEGWAAYRESLMMDDERFAGTDEFTTYADHQSRVLGSPGLNPYKLGKELWEYIENSTNCAEVADKLLCVTGVAWHNSHEMVDFDETQEHFRADPVIDGVNADSLDELPELGPGDSRVDHKMLDRVLSGDDSLNLDAYPWKLLAYEGLAERYYSLVKSQNREFFSQIRCFELEQFSRYMLDDEVYDSVGDALADVDKIAGWDQMREICESHNDVTFLDAFLSKKFVRANHYSAYEHSQSSRQFRVSSSEYRDVKKKLLFQLTNFGKPTIAVYDGNLDNREELLLGRQYNGVTFDMKQTKGVLERVYHLWGRPVNLMTIMEEFDEHEVEVVRRRGREPTFEKRAIRIRYDSESFEEHDFDPELEARIVAGGVDYDTKPDDWL